MDGLNPRQRFCFAFAFLACATLVPAQVAPPPAPPVINGGAPFSMESPNAPSGQLYSIGDPTNEEQYYLELINRARANPTAEGIRLASSTDANVLSAYSVFGVNLALMQAQRVATFSPGSYTGIVRGANGTAGVAVVEVYQLH